MNEVNTKPELFFPIRR